MWVLKATRWLRLEDIELAADLSGERLQLGLAAIAQWRNDPDTAPACPACGTPSLVIIDRSVRPYSEWYALDCPSCGLTATVHVPLAGPGG
jgi:predicted RNA-binding Zn-ribbon protein involved in translation (DUF1610 family)